jgi:hypothetical protein
VTAAATPTVAAPTAQPTATLQSQPLTSQSSSSSNVVSGATSRG